MKTDNDFISGMQRGFVECAEWAENGYLEERARDENLPYEEGNGFTEAARAKLYAAAKSFYLKNKETLHACGLSPEQCGHDLWLTIHGHGAGFWDRGIGQHGEKLTEACKPEKEWHLWPN